MKGILLPQCHLWDASGLPDWREDPEAAEVILKEKEYGRFLEAAPEAAEIILPSGHPDTPKHSYYHPLKAILGADTFLHAVKESGSVLKGVFRLHHVASFPLMERAVSDLLCIEQVFGEAVRMQVKKAQHDSGLMHMIITTAFGNTVIAQFEYTVMEDAEEQLEMEWSGESGILSFDASKQQAFRESGSRQICYDAALAIRNSQPVTETAVSAWNRLKGELS